MVPHSSSAIGVVLNRPGVYRVSLQPQREGVYIYVYVSADDCEPSIDWFADTIEDAMTICYDMYRVGAEQWRPVPHEPWHDPEPGTPC